MSVDARVAEDTFLPAHCRAARALLGMTQEALAVEARIARMTVKRFEAAEPVRQAQVDAIHRVLTEAGIVFMVDGTWCDGRLVAVGIGVVAKSPKR